MVFAFNHYDYTDEYGVRFENETVTNVNASASATHKHILTYVMKLLCFDLIWFDECFAYEIEYDRIENKNI